ncbi:hypothetical protein GJ744_001182 [Endocarpon pusillum]|uniref:Uncharacterized protein n=1 Tax=Endocarpon pusillum TaxID=364733 RepID=A0A8H7ADQ2_9EURO|nr:hypothetical protein GJ744_001182 [Endocarpon pusillum]
MCWIGYLLTEPLITVKSLLRVRITHVKQPSFLREAVSSNTLEILTPVEAQRLVEWDDNSTSIAAPGAVSSAPVPASDSRQEFFSDSGHIATKTFAVSASVGTQSSSRNSHNSKHSIPVALARKGAMPHGRDNQQLFPSVQDHPRDHPRNPPAEDG